MAKKSKLLSALDAHKGRDFKAERQTKLRKAAEKKRRARAAEAGVVEAGDKEEVEEQNVGYSIEPSA
jgi:rRNA-processing protein EBP2